MEELGEWSRGSQQQGFGRDARPMATLARHRKETPRRHECRRGRCDCPSGLKPLQSRRSGVAIRLVTFGIRRTTD